jgi:hypothetical protein
MSKKFTILILCLTILPIVVFLVFNKETEPTVAPVELLPASEEARPITIPASGTTGSTSVQCAVCAQITDGESRDQCMKDFSCI